MLENLALSKLSPLCQDKRIEGKTSEEIAVSQISNRVSEPKPLNASFIAENLKYLNITTHVSSIADTDLIQLFHDSKNISELP